ncbi:MAG: type I restriction enzyme HsdR N-terminal domain-containing protein [Flavobacteriaceae bacterium]|nr:type I restriction enzyme HsdR N-terminal domain-containing protein [Flavobacteriaceae bacterium]
MPVLNFLAPHDFRLKEENAVWYIRDEVRKKWLILTPEEWVRQHIIQHLKQTFSLSDSNILVEKKVEINRQTQRLDVLILKKAQPFLLIECKAPNVKLTEEIFEQVARYNSQIKADYLLITNGLKHIYFHYDKEKNEYSFCEEIEY